MRFYLIKINVQEIEIKDNIFSNYKLLDTKIYS